MLTVPVATLLMLVSLSAEPAPLTAREQAPAARAQTSGAVSTAGPVYLLPDATRTPLKTLIAGTFVRIGEIRGDWIQITFSDGVLGERTGWMERKYLIIGPATESDRPDTRPEPAIPPGLQPRPRAPETQTTYGPPGVRAFASVMADKMAASESFNTIIGKDSIVSFGGGVQAVNLWRGLFVEAAYERSSEDGERVFVLDDEVFPLGIPLQIKMQTIDIVGGWRQSVGGPISAYGGAGATLLRYQETSDFAADDENFDERYTGFVVMGGIDVALAKWVHARGELRYRRVNDVFGVGGVSAEFDESTFGGFGGGIKIAIGR
jgi:hypothetical protein